MILSQVGLPYAGVAAAILSAFVAAGLTAGAQLLGNRYHWCGTPLAHHTHNQSVPRVGGIGVYGAIVLSTVVTLFASVQPLRIVIPILLAALPVFMVGLFDDLRHASPRTKIVAQALGAAILIAANRAVGLHFSLFAALLLGGWIIITTNSFNLIDGLDSLASGSAIVMASCLALINLSAGQPALSFLSLLLVAACLGFFPFNFRKKVFLGDCGSLTIGFILSVIAFETAQVTRSPLAAIAIFGYPLTETSFTVMRRLLAGHPLLRPDREHFHHKLRHAGLSVFQSSGILVLIALAFSLLGVMTELEGSWWLCLAGATVLFYVIGNTFGYLRWSTLAQLRLRLDRSSVEELPDISGYVPNK
jgi:UDP-GlcNAc:undecaprenyl-phosphate GlcNAc-1-phosphate transferase